jgi:hypothetical protein
MKDQKILNLEKRAFMQISFCLWEYGAEEAHEEHPSISVKSFKTANTYFDSLRCPGCSCGSCINLPELASDLDAVPEELKPLASRAREIAKEQLEKQ